MSCNSQPALDHDRERSRDYQSVLRSTPEGRAKSNQAAKDSYHRCKNGLGKRYRARIATMAPKSPRTLQKVCVESARFRAEEKDIPFEITVADLFWPVVCPVTNLVLDYELNASVGSGRGAHRPRSNAPSLDRIIPSKGYVVGNVRVISWKANLLKNDCTDPAVFERMARYIRGEI